jgi:hypothetical protein
VYSWVLLHDCIGPVEAEIEENVKKRHVRAIHRAGEFGGGMHTKLSQGVQKVLGV